MDFLEQAFEPATQAEAVIGGADRIWSTKRTVGNYLMKWGVTIGIDKDGIEIEKDQSLVVKFTQFLLRMTVVLSISMVIYNGVMYVYKASKGENPKDIIKNLIYIGIGILIALFSIVIIRLISSIGGGTLSSIT